MYLSPDDPGIGGVGVPLSALPLWAQKVAGFMPGRYAVELLQPCFNAPAGLHGSTFRLAALAVIGLSAGLSGAKLFRWETGPRSASARWWVATALTAWAAVGAFAWATARLQPLSPELAAWANITEAQIAEIGFDNLPADDGIVAGLVPPTWEPGRSTEFARKLAAWPLGQLADPGQSLRNLVSVAAVADLCADPREAEIGRLVFRQIGRFEPAVARQALAWIIS